LVSVFAVQMSTAQPPKTAASYFPLQIGNEWSYSYGSSHPTVRITDTSRINGYLYYGLSSGVTPPREWYRSSNDSIFINLGGIDTLETLIYNFNANVGDTITLPPTFCCSYGTKILLAGKYDTVVTSSGTYTSCYHFKHGFCCFDAGIHDTWFAYDVGMVKFIRDNFSGMQTYLLDSFKIVTSVKDAQSDCKNISYLLFDSYPNPFNSQTILTYKLDKSSLVSLQIYDLLGRKITELMNERKGPGNYRLFWDTDDIPSGVYFAILSANDFSITRKLVLEK